MIIRFGFIVAVGIFLISCGSKENRSQAADEISGTYVREYSFKVIHQETGNEVGMRTIRDTIFIRLMGQGYEVENRKWLLNDYDRGGWKDMLHTEDRPTPNFEATFNPIDSGLVAQSFPTLYWNHHHSLLSRGKRGENPYLRSQ